MDMDKIVSRDWDNRQFIESLQFNLSGIVSFLNKFESAARERLAAINSKLTTLERFADYLEATLKDPAPHEIGYPLAEEEPETIIVETLAEGTGKRKPKVGTTVSISYTAYIPDGSVVEHYPAETPLEFRIGSQEVIEGLDLCVRRMVAGQQVRVIIPSHLAYGEPGIEGHVPPNCTMTYDVSLDFVE